MTCMKIFCNSFAVVVSLLRNALFNSLWEHSTSALFFLFYMPSDPHSCTNAFYGANKSTQRQSIIYRLLSVCKCTLRVQGSNNNNKKLAMLKHTDGTTSFALLRFVPFLSVFAWGVLPSCPALPWQLQGSLRLWHWWRWMEVISVLLVCTWPGHGAHPLSTERGHYGGSSQTEKAYWKR